MFTAAVREFIMKNEKHHRNIGDVQIMNMYFIHIIFVY